MPDCSNSAMSPYIYHEGRFLLASVCLGAGIAFVYDCLRIFRRVAAHGIFWVSVEDLAYWAFVSISIFCLLYYENNGAFRWFSILGAGGGMAVYKALLGRFLVEYLSRFLLWAKRLWRRFWTWALTPWRMVRRFLGRRAHAGARRAKSTGRLLKKRLTVQARLIKIELRTLYRKADRERKNGQKKNRHQKEKTE